MNAAFSTKKILIHIAFWCFMILFVFDYHWYEISVIQAFGFAGLEVLGYMIIFYLNLSMLYSSSFRNNVFRSILGSILVAFIYIFTLRYSGLESFFYEYQSDRNLFSMTMNSGLFIGLSYMVKYIENGIHQREANLQLTAENRIMQAEVLKSRINPHFIFNTLNNLYALIISKDEKVPHIVSELSNVLRYAADDGTQEYLSIQKEVEHLKSYIDLFLLQEPNSEKIDIYTEGIDKRIKIIPFVLVTFLENAIKHGDLKYNENGFVDISIIVSDVFEFEIVNSKPKADRSNGVGISNIRKQLDLAYDKFYNLEIDSDDEKYKLKLTIPLSKMKSNGN